MKIGIYGGTFNPIHEGHLHILREFYTRLGLDKVLLIPTRMPPHKAAKELAKAQDRYNMCLLAAETLPFPVEVSDIELKRRDKSYTADTLREVKERYPADTLYLLMGEDMFLTVDRWYDPQTTFRLAILCAAPRSPGGYEKLQAFGKKLKAEYQGVRYKIEDIPFWDISSTEIRTGNFEDLPETVRDYITRHGLYQEN